MSHPNPISFAEAERLSEIFDSENREEWQKTSKILHFMDLSGNEKIADVGAGTGYFSNIFSSQVKQGHIFAIDPEPNMVTHMVKRFSGKENVTVLQSAHIDPCIPDNVDVVFLANVYRFIQTRDVFLQNMYQRTKTDARFVFVDFKGENARVSLPTAIEEIKAAGFNIERFDIESCPDHYILAFNK